MRFHDRKDAGRQLARALENEAAPDTLVLGLARGGVPVAREVARQLGAPLDVMVARKLGAPHQPELGVGAIAPGGIRVVHDQLATYLGLTPNQLDQIAHDEALEMERRLVLYRGVPTMPDVQGKRVILVDDGLATGVTAKAALRALRRGQPARLVLAAPVGAPETAREMMHEADEVVCLLQPDDLRAVGLWYDDFGQTSDDEVLAILREAQRPGATVESCPARIPADGGEIHGDLTVPPGARGVILFAHGSGSSRHSPRNRHVASKFQQAGFSTLLMDLLTQDEERVDIVTREHRFDIPLLASRLGLAMDWLAAQASTRALPVGLFGSSTGAAAALVAAARKPELAQAVVSRGGRPDLAADDLPAVEAPTLCIVGGADVDVLDLNRLALDQMNAERALEVVPHATHLFEEPGALDHVADLAAEWFRDHLQPRATGPPRMTPGGR